jgi:hypothetical protein
MLFCVNFCAAAQSQLGAKIAVVANDNLRVSGWRLQLYDNSLQVGR